MKKVFRMTMLLHTYKRTVRPRDRSYLSHFELFEFPKSVWLSSPFYYAVFFFNDKYAAESPFYKDCYTL